MKHCTICLWQEEKISDETFMSLRVVEDGKESFASYEGNIDGCKCCSCIFDSVELEDNIRNAFIAIRRFYSHEKEG